MIYLVFLVLISVSYVKPEATMVTIDPDLALKVANVLTSCLEKTGVDASIMEKVIAWNLEESDDLKKYIHCFATDSGYTDSNGNLVKDKVVETFKDHASADEIGNIVDECNKLKGSDEVDTVFKVSVCFRDKSPVLFKV